MERAELARLLGAKVDAFAPAKASTLEPRAVVVEEREPARFMAAFAGAVAAGGAVFVADPAWGAAERAQFQKIRLPAQSFQLEAPSSKLPTSAGWLCLPTGGSSGAVKLARHDEQTIAAAVGGFCAHFGVRKVNAVGLLPLNHVSGLMAWLRTALTGGEYRAWSWKDLESGARPALPTTGTGEGEGWFLSLVPTQLQRLLADEAAVDWLRGFRAVFIGGGPAWPELIEAGARAGLPLAFSYGMTETAAMVAALRPEEFLAGGRGSGSPLPHARVKLDAEGRVVIAGASLFCGYWPDSREGEEWTTEDLGRFDERGSLHLLGRRDALIITGGKKVDPAEVEAALRGTGEFADVAVIGLPDREWGEVVVACYPQAERAPDFERAVRELAGKLAPYKYPKRYVAVEDWPRSAQGKVNRAALRERIWETGFERQ